MHMSEQTIQDQLFALQDLTYRDFVSKLLPTVDRETIIGIRSPALRKLARELSKTPVADDFLTQLPHTFYEENNLHAFLIEQIKDYTACISALEAFLPYVDNWATCDSLSPKVLSKHRPELLEHINKWIASPHTYTIRFGIGLLMSLYLDEYFQPDYLALVAGVRSEEYYVKMMVAWYFATALAKQYDTALPYIRERRLDPWTHNKAIQKAVESYRISDAQKEELKSFRNKK